MLAQHTPPPFGSVSGLTRPRAQLPVLVEQCSAGPQSLLVLQPLMHFPSATSQTPLQPHCESAKHSTQVRPSQTVPGEQVAWHPELVHSPVSRLQVPTGQSASARQRTHWAGQLPESQ
jgi:hypothetical protein